MTPLVSVCIANYNGIGLIDTCIESVLAQDGHLAVEIIIHDDASTDGSAAHIRACYPDLTLIESDENVGFCIANNRMAENACGEYLLLLNNDAALFHDALPTLYTAARQLDRPAILGLPQYDADTGELLDIGSLLDPFLNPVPNRDPNRLEVGLVMGACLWLPRTMWDELGGFPEWFGSIGEDLLLCARARLSGHRVQALGDSGYRHKVGKSFGGGKARQGRLSTTRRRRALSERNKTFVMLSCYPTPFMQLLLPIHLLLLHLEGGLLTLLHRDSSIWQHIYAPLLPATWRERKRLSMLRQDIQAHRRAGLATWFSVFLWTPQKLKLLFRHGLPEIR